MMSTNIGSLLAARWLGLLSVAIVSAAAAFGAGLLIPKQYEATALVAPAPTGTQSPGLGGLGGQLGILGSVAGSLFQSPVSETDVALAALRSSSFLNEVIERDALLPAIFPQRWNQAAKRWDGEPPTLAQARKFLGGRMLFVSTDRETRLTSITVRARDPETAARLANLLVVRLNERRRDETVREVADLVSYLEAEIARTQAVETRRALVATLESQVARGALARVRMDFAFRVIDPALAPPETDAVQPKPLLMALVAAVIGLLGGVVFIVLRAR